MFRNHDTIMYAIANTDVHYLNARVSHPAVYYSLKVAAKRNQLQDLMADAARCGCYELTDLCVQLGVDWHNNKYQTSIKQLAFENDWEGLVGRLCEYEDDELSFDDLFIE